MRSRLYVISTIHRQSRLKRIAAQVGWKGDVMKAATGIDRSKYYRQWQQTNRRITIHGVCAGCLSCVRRRVWKLGLGSIYCNAACKVDHESRLLIVRTEVAALKRIAAYKPKRLPAPKICSSCNGSILNRRKWKRVCDSCLESRKRDRLAKCAVLQLHEISVEPMTMMLLNWTM